MTKVWVVVHVEIKSVHPTVIDEMVFHVASNLEKAEQYMKVMRIFPDSWWQVLEVTVDNIDLFQDADRIYYYGDKAQKLKSPPYQKAKKAFLKKGNK